MAKPWAQEQIQIFEDTWGKYSLEYISKVLGKNITAIEQWRRTHGYESNTLSHEGITVKELAEAFRVNESSIYKDWIKANSLPIARFNPGGKKPLKMIRLDEFWEWAFNHQYMLDFSQLELNTLGEEPEWVKEARENDIKDIGKRGLERPWSKQEDAKLIDLLKPMKYTYRELATLLERTEIGIQIRIRALNLKLRPIEEKPKNWTNEEIEKMLELLNKRKSSSYIGKVLDRSQMSIKNKILRLRREGKLTS